MVAGESRRLVLLGAPGSGKGTQAERLAATLGVPAISTGEMLREAVAAGTPLGEKVKEIVASGALVDDATMAEVVRDRLDRDDARDGFLLDGYPRNLGQAVALERILGRLDQGLDGVVMIDVPEPELVRRALGRQREDDTEEVIRTRLRVYREQTEPLVAHYRSQGRLLEVDGHRSIEAVTGAILERLEEAA